MRHETGFVQSRISRQHEADRYKSDTLSNKLGYEHSLKEGRISYLVRGESEGLEVVETATFSRDIFCKNPIRSQSLAAKRESVEMPLLFRTSQLQRRPRILAALLSAKTVPTKHSHFCNGSLRKASTLPVPIKRVGTKHLHDRVKTIPLLIQNVTPAQILSKQLRTYDTHRIYLAYRQSVVNLIHFVCL